MGTAKIIGPDYVQREQLACWRAYNYLFLCMPAELQFKLLEHKNNVIQRTLGNIDKKNKIIRCTK